MEDRITSASLVIGGTGMLAAATRWLAGRSRITLLAARHATRFAAGDPAFLPLDVDWDGPAFREVLGDAIGAAPAIGTALLWIHEPEPVLRWLLPLLGPAKVVLVLGSVHGSPEIPAAAAGIAVVRLGSKATGAGRRWLTDAEISDGALRALRDGRSTIVGDLLPLP